MTHNMSHVRKSLHLNNDITIVSHEIINQSKYNYDSQVRSHVRSMSQVTS